jgi:glycosyltransferase EpsF
VQDRIDINANVLRVAHVIGNVAKGGVEAVVFSYYRAIDRKHVQFDFIIDEDSPSEIPGDILELGCRIYKIPSYKYLSAHIGALKKIFIEGHYQIVHSHMNTLSVFTLYAAKRVGVPVRIAHSHSTAGKGEFLRNLMKYALRPFSRLFSTHLFACSEYAGRWLFGNRAVAKGKVTVIRNAIDTSSFCFNAETRERVRRELDIADKFAVGHIGRFVAQKNHSFLLEIFVEVHRQDRESVLLLIGDGELKNAMVEKAQQLGLSDCVRFLGMRGDVNELYQAMDALVLPSLYEGLPVVGVEAQCAGLPCVFSSAITSEAITGDSVEVLPLANNASEWAQKVLRRKPGVRRDEESQRCAADWEISGEAKKLTLLYRPATKAQ